MTYLDIALIVCAVNMLFIGMYFTARYLPTLIKNCYIVMKNNIEARKVAKIQAQKIAQPINSDLLEKATKFIANFEGFRTQAYSDVGGKLTIGYGQRIGLNDYPNGITEADAQHLLQNQLQIEQKAILSLINVLATDNQIIALLSLVYNIGTHAFTASTLLKKINAKKPIEEIKAEFLRWDHVNGVEVTGLLNRRKAEADLYAA